MRTACYVIHGNEAESKEYLVRSHEKTGDLREDSLIKET